MLDRHRDPPVRLAAAQQVGRVGDAPDPQRYLAALHEVAWSDRQPAELRRYAIDRLIEHDPAAFQRAADEHITDIDDWGVLGHVCGRAVAGDWQAFTPALVRRLAQPSLHYPDVADRPEARALAALHPDRSLVEVAHSVFVGFDPAVTSAHQAAAWRLMGRLLDPAARRAWLTSSPADTPLVADLHAAAALLDHLPDEPGELLWLAHLRTQEGGQAWRRAGEIVATLTPEQRRGLAVRHLPLLLHRGGDCRGASSPLAASREGAQEVAPATLAARIAQRLTDGEHVTRTDRVGTTWTESFDADRDGLAWADLLAIDRLLDVMADRAAVRTWFAQADADLADTTSEHGGVLAFTAEGVMVQPMPPDLRLHDRRFIASVTLIERMYAGLAHYHFHAQQHDNAAFAGPGGGDLAFADRFGTAAVVLTFIDADTLNVDYYQAGGLAVDLGVIRR